MAADEDDDYMGDLERFIPKEDLLPVKVRKEKGGTGKKEKVNWKEKRKSKEAKKVMTEAEQRQEGLAAAIPSSNIGFKLLQQMGYQPGNALGKHGQGTIEPVNVDLKFNRTGLGRDRVVQEEKILKTKFKALAQERKRKKVDELQVGFQERRRGTWQSRKLVSDYRKACTALLQLEERAAAAASMEGGVSKEGSQEPRAAATNGVEKEGDADEEEEEEVITEEMLQVTLSRLRAIFNYCLYCGFQYDSAEQLQSNCPGEEEDDH